MEVGEGYKESGGESKLERVLEKLSEQDREVVESEIQRLKEVAGYDHLLEKEGVLNKRGLYREMSREFSRLKRGERQELVVVIWDIDYFKKINDEFGHVLGDEILKDVAKSMNEKARDTDVVARVGGDELVQILPVTYIEEGFGDGGEKLDQRLAEIGQTMREKIVKREKESNSVWPEENGKKAGEISYGYKRWDWVEVESKQEEWGEKWWEEMEPDELYSSLVEEADDKLLEVKRER